MNRWKKILCSILAASMITGNTVYASEGLGNTKSVESTVESEDTKVDKETSYLDGYEKITDISDATIMGADFSHYQQDLIWKKVYYDYKGIRVQNLFDFVKSQGINTISVRVAVNPKGEFEYLSLENAAKTIKAAKAAGLNTNMILMYSDVVTYENTQQLPDGWAAGSEVKEAEQYTNMVLDKLEKDDSLPTMITIGNELNYNFLNLSDYDNWVAIGKMSQIVKSKKIKVAVGIAAPSQAEDIQWMIEKLEDPFVAAVYDYVGVSIYPNDTTVSYMETLRTTFTNKTKGKQLFVSSVKYKRVSSTDSTVGVETQAESIYNLLSATIDSNNAGGLIYEEAEFVGSWNSFFDEFGNAQNSLAIFAYAQGNKVDVDSAKNPFQYGGDTGLKGQNVTIKKIKGMTDSAIRGMDIGSYIALKNAGVKYYNHKGEEESLLKILHDNGVNYIRIRIWNDPYNEKGETYGGGNCDVETGLKIAREANKYGMKILLCFHYSDFWADPTQQFIPKAWRDAAKNPEKMRKYIYDFTKDTVKQFVDAGAEVGMVQVGNEITNGMLGTLVDSTKKETYNAVWGDKTKSTLVNSYLSAGSKAVREAAPDALIALHLETATVAKYTTIMNTWERDKVDYDVLGSSYYPFWGIGSKANTPERIREIQNLAASKGKMLSILEVSWLNTLEDTDGTPNSVGELQNTSAYPIGPQGQVDCLTDMYTELMSQPNGLGAFYWEPGWIAVKAGWINWEENKRLADEFGTGWASTGALGYISDKKMYYNGEPVWGGSSWDNQSLFDSNGYALQSLKFFKDSISGGKEQTAVLHYVDSTGKELSKRTFTKVALGSSKTVTLPTVAGYSELNKAATLKVTGDTEGVKHYYVTYGRVQNIATKKSSYSMTYGAGLDLAKEITLSQKAGTTYSSSNSKVVSVDAKTGKMKANGVGTAVITITAAKTTASTAATKKITVKVLPKVTVKNEGTQIFTAGKAYKHSSYITISGTSTTKFTSSNKSIVKVDKNGKVTAVKPGKATITVKVTAAGMSDCITKKTTIYVAPKQQKITKVTGSSKALTVTLNKDTTASGYEIMVAKNSKFTSGKKVVTVKNTKTVKTKISKLSKKKQYYVRVRSYKVIDNKKHYGNWSKTVKAKTK